MLLSGKAKSCGCLAKEIAAEGKLTHGKSRSRIYTIWKGMVRRCTKQTDPTSWNRYGGRGITVCDEWLVFENFYADMGDPPDRFSIDRKDNNGGYSKDNCKWVDRTTQQRNTRSNHVITINGVSKCASEWADIFHINRSTLYERLRSGWEIEQALGIEKRPMPRYTRPDVVWVEHNGERKTLRDWCEQLGLKLGTIRGRIYRKGCSSSEALGFDK